ncbi:MAG TPA: queuosine precursor transporter [Polyangia bacterium]|jgi:hypothetical protein|nr:queuosine precursor transporter [Polyangia bacterium]
MHAHRTSTLDRAARVFFALGGLFLTCLVVSDIIGGAKLAHIGEIAGRPIIISVGMLAFPITFVLTDLVNEFYGGAATRFLSYVGLGMLLLTLGVLLLATALPPAAHTPFPDEMFGRIFGSSLRGILASATAYFVGQLIDIFLFGVLRRLARGRYIWLRATGSTVVSQLVDTLVVQFIIWGGRLPQQEIWDLAANSYVLKFLLALAATPAIYLGHGVLGRLLHMEPTPEALEEAAPAGSSAG